MIREANRHRLVRMGIMDRLFGRSSDKGSTSNKGEGPEEAPAPEVLRQRLFDAIHAGDGGALEAMCAKHEPLILASFDEWQRVPEGFRVPDKLQWYGTGLIGLAQHFAQERGKPQLLQKMMGAPDDNPMERWGRTLGEVRPLMEELRYEEAISMLREAISSTEGMQGPGVDRYLPVMQGRIGECLMQTGDIEGARDMTERALAGCSSSEELEGVIAYLGNLVEIHRYRGDHAAAADHLEQLADALAKTSRADESEPLRRRAAMVRAGEPLCRVVAEIDGQRMELGDIVEPQGSIRFIFLRNRMTLRRSLEAVKQGLAAISRGDRAAALSCFERASAADPFDPWPRYHAGLALTELRRYREAVAAYRATEALAPGWYHCRADLWLAERLDDGALSHEIFAAIRALTDGNRSPLEAADLAERTLQQADLAVLRLHLGDAFLALGREREAEAAYRHGLTLADDQPDVRTRLLVALANATTDPLERARSLHTAVDLAGNLTAAAMARLMLAANPSAKRE